LVFDEKRSWERAGKERLGPSDCRLRSRLQTAKPAPGNF
jgi:hypothetical protein